jgi:glycosyltransferase involved in cell wall biosynthesis
LLGALAQIPEAYLWLAGEGPERDRLESLVRELGLAARVRFLGWRDDTAELFAAADVFVCPSRHEPLGNVVIEAWAQGLPVVAAAAAGPAALIGEGESGLLVPFDEPQALAAALQRLLGDGDLAARLGEGGRVAYRAEFSEEVVVAQYLDFFARVRQD